MNVQDLIDILNKLPPHQYIDVRDHSGLTVGEIDKVDYANNGAFGGAPTVAIFFTETKKWAMHKPSTAIE